MNSVKKVYECWLTFGRFAGKMYYLCIKCVWILGARLYCIVWILFGKSLTWLLICNTIIHKRSPNEEYSVHLK